MLLSIEHTFSAHVFGQTHGTGVQRVTGTDLIKKVLYWLPIDTETVMVSRASLIRGDDQKSRPVSGQDEHRQWILITGPLFHANYKSYERSLAGCKILLVVESARKFRPPSDLGIGCGVKEEREPSQKVFRNGGSLIVPRQFGLFGITITATRSSTSILHYQKIASLICTMHGIVGQLV